MLDSYIILQVEVNMLESDESVASNSDAVSGRDELPRRNLCTATRFKLQVDSVLLTGAVKGKYEVQGSLSVLGYHGKVVPLERIKGKCIILCTLLKTT